MANLCTVQDAKLRARVTDSEHDALFNMLVSAVSDEITTMLDRRFEQTTVTRVYDYVSNGIYSVPAGATITGVAIDGVAQVLGVGYRVYSSYVRAGYYRWPALPYQAVSITYIYDTDVVPPGVRNLAAKAVAREFKDVQEGLQTHGGNAEMGESWHVVSLTPEEVQALNRYRFAGAVLA